MKHMNKIVPIVMLVTMLAFAGVVHAQAEDPFSPVNDALGQFAAALGLGAVVSTLVQVLKAFNVIPDGYGGQITLGLNLIIFIGATVAGFFGVDVGDDAVKQALSVVGQLIVVILSSLLYFKGMRESLIPGFGPRSE